MDIMNEFVAAWATYNRLKVDERSTIYKTKAAIERANVAMAQILNIVEHHARETGAEPDYLPAIRRIFSHINYQLSYWEQEEHDLNSARVCGPPASMTSMYNANLPQAYPYRGWVDTFWPVQPVADPDWAFVGSEDPVGGEWMESDSNTDSTPDTDISDISDDAEEN